MGSALFLGARNPAEIAVEAGPVIAYTGVHLLAFFGLGVGASLLLSHARRRPRVILAGLLLAAAGFALFLALLTILAEFLLGDLAWWSIAGASVFAAVAMSLHLAATHPGADAVRDRDPFEKT